jgi:hypothetical protein
MSPILSWFGISFLICEGEQVCVQVKQGDSNNRVL